MNLKEQIRYNATEYEKPVYSVNEMAQSHIDNAVIDSIKAGNFEDAAQRYIENHGSAKPAGKADATVNKVMKGQIAKSIKADADKVSGVSNDEWEKFKEAYAEIQGTKGQTTRQYKKKVGTVDKATGEVQTSAQSQDKTLSKLEQKVEKLHAEYKEAIKNADSEEKKEDLESAMEGLNILYQGMQSAQRGKPPLAPTSEKDIEALKARLQKIGKTYVQRQGPDKEKEKKSAEMEKGIQQAHKDIMQRITGIKDLEDIEDLVADFRERKERMANAKPDVSGLEDLKKNEAFREKERILSESFGYRGFNFWENYTGTTLIRMFNEDVRKMGAVNAANSYIDIFGEETIPIFKYLAQNKEQLNEASHIESELLFESNYLEEKTLNKLGKIGAETGKKVMMKQGGLGAFLQGTWKRLKKFGQPIVEKLGLFLGRGVKWAKELATKGLEFIWSNPITKIAVPVVALAGTVAGGIALLNKIRKRAGKPQLSPQEKEEFKEVVAKKDDKLEKLNVSTEA